MIRERVSLNQIIPIPELKSYRTRNTNVIGWEVLVTYFQALDSTKFNIAK